MLASLLQKLHHLFDHTFVKLHIPKTSCIDAVLSLSFIPDLFVMQFEQHVDNTTLTGADVMFGSPSRC